MIFFIIPLALSLEVTIDPYREIYDYNEPNAYYFYEECQSNCIEVTESIETKREARHVESVLEILSPNYRPPLLFPPYF